MRLGDPWYLENGSNAELDAQAAQAADAVAPGIVAQAQAIAVAGESIVSAITRAMQTVAMTDAQREILNIQLDRARNGLPPLVGAQYGIPGLPGASASGAITPAMLLVIVGLVVLVMSQRGK
jgi:hypothetical protein